MKATNTHTTAEGWLMAATNELRPYFAKLGYTLPEKARFAIAFPSTGKRGRSFGECWHPAASEDGYYKIIIRADKADPVDVLGVLVHELVHSVLPPNAKHGQKFREVALRVGLEGEMRHAYPTPLLKERLAVIANNIGALPHAKLNFSGASDVPKKQRSRHHRAECSSCAYAVQITAKWAKVGLPICPAKAEHGLLQYDFPEEDGDESEPNSAVTTNTAADEAIETRTVTQHNKKKPKPAPGASAELFNTPA
jgi:hypothetical protein